MPNITYILALIALVVGLFVYVPEANLSTGEIIGLIITVVFAIYLGSGLVSSGRMTMSEGVKNAAIWIVIFLAIIAGYAYKNEITDSRIFASLKPNSGVVNEEDNSVTFYKSSDGHFHVSIEINNTPVDFMVDTGATGIVLSKQDAKKVGIDIENIAFSQMVSTANGMSRVGSVKVRQFVFKNVDYGDIYVSVNEGEMRGSLLGMKFLNMTDGFTIRGNQLVIYQ